MHYLLIYPTHKSTHGTKDETSAHLRIALEVQVSYACARAARMLSSGDVKKVETRYFKNLKAEASY